MRKIIIVLICFICLVTFETRVFAQNLNEVSIEQSEKSKQDKVTNDWSGLEYFTKVVALLSAIIATIYGIREYKMKVRENRQKNISNLLILLSDSNSDKRAGAANSLSKYSNEVVDELLYSISVENDELVRYAMENALLTIDKRYIRKVIDVHHNALKESVKVAGFLKNTKNWDYSYFGRDKTVEKSVKDHYGYLFDVGNNIAKMNYYASTMDMPNVYQKKLLNIKNTIESTSWILSQILDKTSDEIKYIDVSYKELYRNNFKNLSIKGLYAVYAVCRHITFENCTIKGSIFKNADLFDAHLKNVVFHDCNLQSCHLRKSKSINVEIRECEDAEEIIFSEAEIEKFVSIKNNFYKGNFRGFKAPKCILKDTDFYSSEFKGANLSGSTMEKCDFNKADLTNCDFSNATINNCTFDGADLTGANFNNAKVEVTSFKDANMKNVEGLHVLKLPK